jgi:mRNA-degrading endonuclease RelE of RelBE toxin-antitoxin system
VVVNNGKLVSELEMYDIEFTSDALEDLKAFKKFEQQKIISGIDIQLKYEPTVETRNRFRMRPNKVAEWELRLGKYRVFYHVEQVIHIVSIEVIGFKSGNRLFVRGRRREL